MFKSNKDKIRDELIRLATISSIKQNSEIEPGTTNTYNFMDPPNNVSPSPVKTNLKYIDQLYLNSIYFNNNVNGERQFTGEKSPYYMLGFILKEAKDENPHADEFPDFIKIRVYDTKKPKKDSDNNYDYEILDPENNIRKQTKQGSFSEPKLVFLN